MTEGWGSGNIAALTAALLIASPAVAEADARRHAKFQFPPEAPRFAAPPIPERPVGQCGPSDRVESVLREQHGETVYSQMIGSNQIIQVWGNTESGSWTITRTRPDGITCLLGSGEAFEPLSEPQGVEG